MRSEALRWIAGALGALALGACGGDWVDPDREAGRFFRISGSVEVSTGTTPDQLGAAIAWIWEAGGGRYARVQAVGLEPRVVSYVLDVPAPPEIAEAAISEAGRAETVAGVSLAIGVPFLYERPSGAEGDPRLEVRLDGLSEWISGNVRDLGQVVTPATGASERIFAATTDHLVIVSWTEPSVELLSQSERFPALPSREALQDVWNGQSLYRRDESIGHRWEPLAAPGQRTEFQGITMRPPGL